ncbi:MAG: hypothetical protein LBE12_08070 [Planctomycetaceae bacterium]|jgi:hypothetical protein|nr:hypothetical protein [Planctomycetaceae bacterium]
MTLIFLLTNRTRLLILTLFGICFLSVVVAVQGQAVREVTADSLKISPPPIEQAPLDAVVIFNSEGKRLLYLPKGWPLEDLDDFWNFLLRDRKNPLPPFGLQEINVVGKVVDRRVETEIRIVLTTFNNRPLLVPIGMKEGILPADGKLKPIFRGPGSFDLTVDPQSGQYLVLIRPQLPETTKYQPENFTTTSPAQLTPEPEISAISELSSVPLPEKLSEPPKSTAINNTTDTATDSTINSKDPKEKKTPLEQHYELILPFWFPLTHIGNEENRLTVSFPQAVNSQFVLLVPEKEIAATVSQGALLNSLELPNQPVTQFKILGLSSDFELAWRKKKTEPLDNRPVFYVEDALIKVQLEEKSNIYDVILPVRSPPASFFDRLRIRLPSGTVLDRETTEKYAAGGYSFDWVKEEKKETTTSPILEIRLPRKTSGSVNIRLKAIQQLNTEKKDIWRDFGGFEVIGAERQFGYLTAAVPPDTRSNWKPIRGIRQTEISDSAIYGEVDARFEFFSQPFLLQGRIVSPQPRTNVKPEYQIGINKGSLLLTARLTYEVLGSKTESLSIRLPGWKWSGEIKPSNIIDTVGVEQDENGLLTIPFRTPTDGSFEIELKAHRSLSTEEGDEKQRLVIPLPKPLVTWSEPAPVVIVPADNVEVIPIDEDTDSGLTTAPELNNTKPNTTKPNSTEPNSTEPNNTELNTAEPKRTLGLTRRSRRSQTIRIEIPERQQEPLFYRTEPTDAVFVADIRYHRQKIKAAMRTDIRLRDLNDQVDQIISYDVSYVPVEKLYFLVPKMLEENGHLQVKIGNRPLELRDVTSNSTSNSALNGTLNGTENSTENGMENWSRKLVMLPESLFKFQLVFRYSIPPVPIEYDMTTPFSLSLIRPAETLVSDHRVNLIVPPGYLIELHNDVNRLWNTTTPDSPTLGTSFQSSQSPNKISLLISLSNHAALGTTIIERAWLQTWLTGSLRQDRGEYLITSDRESVTLNLPLAAGKGKVFVSIDRVPVLAEVSSKGELTIPLTLEQRQRSVLVEIVYRFPFETVRSLAELELPYFNSESLIRCEYWQVILPQDRHILNIPTGWTPEYRWAWNNLFWGRIPSLQKKDIGLPDDSPESPAISTRSNQYLFSSLHPAPETSLYIVGRSLIVLLSSGLSLLIGLTLIYFPQTRYAGSLFGLGVVLLAILFYRPAPVLLMLQASSFGVFLALGAAYVYRIVYREEKWVVPVSRTWDESSQTSKVYSVIIDEETEPEKKEEKKESS